MSPTFAQRICCAGLFAALTATAACQSSAGSKTASAASDAATATTSVASDAPSAPDEGAGGVGAGLTGIDAKYCAAIKVADAQALTTATLSPAKTGGPESCTFVLPGQDLGGDNITITDFPGDSDKQYYNDSLKNLLENGGTALPDVGDEAEWGQPFAGHSAPEVVARKGALTCVVQPPSDLSTMTIDKTGDGPIYGVSASAAASFAVKMGALCNDVFSVGS